MDTANGNGAGANQYGNAAAMIELAYGGTNPNGVTMAPQALDRSTAKCGTQMCSAVAGASNNVLGT